MPKEIDYTNDSFEKSLNLAEAIHSIAPCSAAAAAKKLKRKSSTSGSFNNLIASTKKFGLIDMLDDKLVTTELFRNIKNAYSITEKNELLRQAFLGVKLYGELYNRFKTKGYPEDTIRVILIREYDVGEKNANRIAGYFKNGAILCGLLNDDNTFTDIAEPIGVEVVTDVEKSSDVGDLKTDLEDEYIISIKGPSGNLVGPIIIIDLDQFEFTKNSVIIALELIEKKLKEKKLDENI